MSSGEHAVAVGAEPHPHASNLFYVEVAVVLTVLTILEIWCFYIPSLRPLLVPTLLILSGAKFALVVMFYMHLKFDSRAYTAVLLPLLALAAFIIIALMVIMRYYYSLA